MMMMMMMVVVVVVIAVYYFNDGAISQLPAFLAFILGYCTFIC